MNQIMIAATFVIALIATAVVAEPPAQGISPEMQNALREKMQQKMRETDANSDGAISREEFMAQAETRFKNADLNGDGKITADEFAAINQKLIQQAIAQRNAAARK